MYSKKQKARRSMGYHRDETKSELNVAKGCNRKTIKVISFNLYIDPKHVKNVVIIAKDEQWSLLIRDAKTKKLKAQIYQEDNEVVFQPEEMQEYFEHRPEGKHTKYWRIVITFRLKIIQFDFNRFLDLFIGKLLLWN
jgi:hypothetical protein